MKINCSKKVQVLFVISIVLVVALGVGLGVGLSGRSNGDSQTAIGNNPYVPGGGSNTSETTPANAPELYQYGSPIGEGTYYIRCLLAGAAIAWNATEERVVYSAKLVTGLPRETWIFENAGTGFVYIKSAETGHYVFAFDEGGPFRTVRSSSDPNMASKWAIMENGYSQGRTAYGILQTPVVNGSNFGWNAEYGYALYARIILFPWKDLEWNPENQLFTIEPVGSGIQAGTYRIGKTSTTSSVVTDNSNRLALASTAGDTWKIISVATNRLWLRNLTKSLWLSYEGSDNANESLPASLSSSPSDFWLSQVGNPGRASICQSSSDVIHCLSLGSDGSLYFVPTTGNSTMDQWFDFTLTRIE